MAPLEEKNRVAAAVAQYVLAVATADEAALRSVFHPSASVVGNYHGAVEWLSLDAYVQEVRGANLPPNLSPEWTLTAITILADTAVAEIEDQFGSMNFTNFLSLLRIDGDWKIVAKLYHVKD